MFLLQKGSLNLKIQEVKEFNFLKMTLPTLNLKIFVSTHHVRTYINTLGKNNVLSEIINREKRHTLVYIQ